MSGAYGYNGELVYFQDVFAQFRDRFPQGFVPVADSFPVEKYPSLPLRPLMKFRVLGRTRRTVGEVTYLGVRRIPTIGSMIRLARTRPDVLILVEFSLTALSGFVLAALTRSRTVLLIESDPSYRGAPAGRMSRSVKRFVSRRVGAVLVSNQLGAAFVRDSLGVSDSKVVVGPYLTSVPPGAESESMAIAAGAGREDREPTRILFLNSVTARKGVFELVDALASLNEQLRHSWRLDVVGDGADLERLVTYVGDHDLIDNVVFHGRARYDETGRFYANSDLVVCPTLADYRSLSGFEAVNAGKPVIVSIHDGAHHEILEYAPGAQAVDPKDREAFASMLHSYVAGDGVLEAAQKRARAIPEQFSLHAIGENLQRAVAMATGEHREARASAT